MNLESTCPECRSEKLAVRHDSMVLGPKAKILCIKCGWSGLCKDLAAPIDLTKTIYDSADRLDRMLSRAAPRIYDVMRELLRAVDERPVLADSIESSLLSRARQLIAELRV
jgi:hypothetical protein